MDAAQPLAVAAFLLARAKRVVETWARALLERPRFMDA
jgi:hypothetical protein